MQDYEHLKRLASAISQNGSGYVRALILLELAKNPKEGIALTALSRECRCTPSNITSLADSLESDGLVERKDSPDDRRVTLLGITRKGLAAIEAAKNKEALTK